MILYDSIMLYMIMNAMFQNIPAEVLSLKQEVSRMSKSLKVCNCISGVFNQKSTLYLKKRSRQDFFLIQGRFKAILWIYSRRDSMTLFPNISAAAKCHKGYVKLFLYYVKVLMFVHDVKTFMFILRQAIQFLGHIDPHL